jgi:hypothetical protein
MTTTPDYPAANESVTERDKADAVALIERAGIDLDDWDVFLADLAQTIANGRRMYGLPAYSLELAAAAIAKEAFPKGRETAREYRLRQAQAALAVVAPLLEDARHYAAVCPVPDALSEPTRFEMLERRARIAGAGRE